MDPKKDFMAKNHKICVMDLFQRYTRKEIWNLCELEKKEKFFVGLIL